MQNHTEIAPKSYFRSFLDPKGAIFDEKSEFGNFFLHLSDPEMT